jgi:RNA polymerase sigma-70 factor (ECF subfamily)
LKPALATFDALFRTHAPSVFRRASRMLGNDADAHEIVSDVFLSLYERPAQYEGKSSLSTFLYAMTTNACLNRIRSRERRRRWLEKASAEVPDLAPRPVPPDRFTLLKRVLDRMPEELARIAVYYFMDELTQDEVSELLGCTRAQVRSLLARLDSWCAAEAAGEGAS